MVRPRDRRFGRTPPSAGLIAWRRSTQICSNHHVVALASRCHLPPVNLVPTCSSRQDAPSPATRTLLMQVGPIRPFSDAAGLHVVHLGDCAAGLSELATRLETAGCGVDRTGQDWLKVKFKASGEKPPVGAHAAPLHSCKYRRLHAPATKLRCSRGQNGDNPVRKRGRSASRCKAKAVGLRSSSSLPILSSILRRMDTSSRARRSSPSERSWRSRTRAPCCGCAAS